MRPSAVYEGVWEAGTAPPPAVLGAVVESYCRRSRHSTIQVRISHLVELSRSSLQSLTGTTETHLERIQPCEETGWPDSAQKMDGNNSSGAGVSTAPSGENGSRTAPSSPTWSMPRRAGSPGIRTSCHSLPCCCGATTANAMAGGSQISAPS